MKTEAKDIVYYLSLPYTTVLRRDDDGDVIARIEELPGCVAHGADEPEALANIASMKQLWIEDALAAGEEIPEPEEAEPLPSGKWVQRVPKTLHQKLVRMAKNEGVSLNQLVTQMLSEACGARKIQIAIEQMLANCVTQQFLKPAPHYWDVSLQLPPGEWSLDWNPGAPTNIRNLEKFMPTRFEMKVRDAGEHKTDYCPVSRR